MPAIATPRKEKLGGSWFKGSTGNKLGVPISRNKPANKWWLMPIIPDTQMPEIGGLLYKATPGK
jgi:hypothetical protein